VWQLAVIAMAHSGGGAEFLIRQKDGADHLKHAAARYPNEVRFALAVPLNEMVTRVANNRPGVKLVSLVRRSDVPNEGSATRFIDRVLGQLDGLATTPGIAEEALMRAGVIRFQIAQFERALVNLSQAAKSDDRFIQYMSHLFEGKVLEALGRRSAALAAYESAHRSDPDGQSAALQFAAALFTSGRRDEAMSIVEGAIRDRDDAIADWWYVYGSGDYRYWSTYRRQLRESIKN
jgi:tetratricopeptide (TPR) repeat protein